MNNKKNTKKINCISCEKMITGYLKNNLSIYDVDMMLEHVKKCDSCMEELTIQFLVTEGLSSVEESGNYNLVNALDEKLYNSERRIEKYLSRINASIAVLSLILLASISTIIMLLVK